MEYIIYICTALAALESVMFAGFRIGFVFIDHNTKPFFSRLLWAVCIINAVGLFALSQRYLSGKVNGLKGLAFTAVAITAMFLVICSVFIIRDGKKELKNFALTAAPPAPFFAVCYAALYFGLLNPLVSEAARLSAFAIAAASLAAVFLLRLLPVIPLKFSSPPAVFDFGEYYSVAFASNIKSVGYLKIMTDGREHIIYDSFAGRKRISRLHSVKVPKEILSGEYTTGINRAVEYLAYGGILGKKAKEFTVRGFSSEIKEPDRLKLCVLTDWHNLYKQAKMCAGEDCNAFVFLGDFSQGVYSEGVVIKMLLAPAAGFTKGNKPLLFVRGNHDFRGPAAEYVLEIAKTEHISFRTVLGGYEFFVVDSGEDKPDDNYEYAGYNDFSRFRSEEAEYLKSIEPDGSMRTVLLSHSKDLLESGDWPKRAYEAIRGKRFLLHLYGHNHACRIGRYENGQLDIPEQPFPCVCCGGASDGVFTYANITLDGENVSVKWKEAATGSVVKAAEIDANGSIKTL